VLLDLASSSFLICFKVRIIENIDEFFVAVPKETKAREKSHK